MSYLTNSISKEHFDTSFQAFFNKVLVSKPLANFRFEKELSWGKTLARVIFDYNGLVVSDVTNGTALTYADLSDQKETLTVNKYKHVGFRIFDDEKKQAGPLSPGEMAGKQAAQWLAQDVDANFFAEVRNASVNLDNGDLTTRISSGTPITLSATTVPQMISQGRAKLQSNPMNQTLTDIVWVIDPYAGSQIEQYVLGKNIDLAGRVFANGYVGDVGGARVYVSDNLAADAVLTITTNPANGETFTLNGFTYTFVTTIGTTAGNVLVEATVDAARANLAAALNQGAGAGTKYIAWTNVSPTFYLNKHKRLGITATNNDTADTLSLATIGSGALIIGGTMTQTITSNYVNSYFGKPRVIDEVIQMETNLEVIRDKGDYADYVRSNKLWALKTFADAKDQFLRVKIAA